MRRDSGTIRYEEDTEEDYKPFQPYELEIAGRVLDYIEERFDAQGKDIGQIKSLLHRVKVEAR